MRTSPLVQLLFSYEENPLNTPEVNGLKLSFEEIASSMTRFELELELALQAGALEGWINYDRDLFGDALIEQFARHYGGLLDAVSREPGRAGGEVVYLDAADAAWLDGATRGATLPYDADATFVSLFERSVARRGDAPALWVDGRELSYAELDRASRALAVALARRGVVRGQPVPLLMEASLEFFVSMLAVLRLGAAYVPLDPAYPMERLLFMLRDTGSGICLTRPGGVQPEGYDGDVFVVDAAAYEGDGADFVRVDVGTGDLAYLIYTSGSTGKPKGVMVEHRGFANMLNVGIAEYDVTERSRVLQFASVSFDVSLFEMTMALLGGGALFVPPRGTIADYRAFEAFVAEHRIDLAWLPPPYAARLQPEAFPSVRTMAVGGSASTWSLVDAWRGSTRLINSYGPTEATVFTTYWPAVADDGSRSPNVPIGRPLHNTRLRIVDGRGMDVPRWVPGEVVLGGLHIARGYLNRPELTTEKFYVDAEGVRWYRTGDIGRWLASGDVEYMGRNDDQVKVRGFRVELGEIAEALKKCPDVADAIVYMFDRQNADQYLCAYVVAKPGFSADAARERLWATLPAYMVPTFIIPLTEMPLTPNGKIDKQALPKPEAQAGVEYVEPREGAEAKLAAIWKETLGIERVGADDNFFDVGGTSLSLIAVNARMRDVFGRDVPVIKLFEYPTVKSLAHHLEHEEEEARAREERLGAELEKSRDTMSKTLSKLKRN